MRQQASHAQLPTDDSDLARMNRCTDVCIYRPMLGRKRKRGAQPLMNGATTVWGLGAGWLESNSHIRDQSCMALHANKNRYLCCMWARSSMQCSFCTLSKILATHPGRLDAVGMCHTVGPRCRHATHNAHQLANVLLEIST